MTDIVVSALYKFVTLDDYAALRKPLLKLMEEHHVKGTLLLAKEGINGTIAGDCKGIDALLAWLRSDPRFADIETKESYEQAMPFYRSKVKLKKEIVTMGIEGIDPKNIVGTYVKPKDWNALISDPDVLLIDTRNDYEVKIGTFKGAVNPETETFREFSQYVKKQLDPAKHKKVAMYCTGGIRCEKASAYLVHHGFQNVNQLGGGIIQYAHDVKAMGLKSKFIGKNFVFDARMGERVTDDILGVCHQCGKPADTHLDCGNDACHILFIQCDKCNEKYAGCCSAECKEFASLPVAKQRLFRKDPEKVVSRARYSSRVKPRLNDLN